MASPSPLPSLPAMPPLNPEQKHHLQFSDDKYFAFHGKIMLLVTVFFFFLYIVFILMIPFLKNSNSEAEGYGDNFIGDLEIDPSSDAYSPCNCEAKARKLPL